MFELFKEGSRLVNEFDTSEEFLDLVWNISHLEELSELKETLMMKYEVYRIIINIIEKKLVSTDALLIGLKSLLALGDQRREEARG